MRMVPVPIRTVPHGGPCPIQPPRNVPCRGSQRAVRAGSTKDRAMIAGLLLAMLASLGSGIGSAVEAFGVRRAAARGERPGDVGQLLREPLYLGGLTIDLLGFVFTVLALQLLPLFLVQAVVASSVGVTAIVVAISGRPLGRAGWFALAASLAGLVLLAMSAPCTTFRCRPSPWHWALLGMALPIGAIGLLAVRSTSRWSAAVLAFAAGLAFSCIAVGAKPRDARSRMESRSRAGGVGDRGQRHPRHRALRDGAAARSGDPRRGRHVHHRDGAAGDHRPHSARRSGARGLRPRGGGRVLDRRRRRDRARPVSPSPHRRTRPPRCAPTPPPRDPGFARINFLPRGRTSRFWD